MRTHALRSFASALSLVALGSSAAVAALLASCSSDVTQPPIVPAGPPTLEPEGCSFKIRGRPDYVGFTVGKTDVGATPNIRRVRLGLGGNVSQDAEGRADPATSAGFSWQTDEGTLVSEVQWGTTPDPATWPSENRTSGATWLTPAGLLNPNGDARMHEAHVCGLSPATTYYYRVGGGPPGTEAWSDVYTFTTTPSDPSTPVTFGITGDSRGQDNDAYRLIQRRMQLAGVTMQLFSGDMVNFAPDQLEWEKWLDLAWRDTDGSLLTLGQKLTLWAHGNHENYTTLFFGNLVMPQEPDTFPNYGELFFSVDVGPVHVVVIDDLGVAYPDEVYKEALTKWLRADLEAANKNRSNVPWIVTMHHHSEFSSANHGQDKDVLRVRDFFVPLWDEFHVDLNVAGHDHNYERTKPLTGPAATPTVKDSFADGTVYLVCAGAGADAYSAGTSAFTEVSRDYKTGGALGFYAFLKADKASLKLESHELRSDASDPIIDEMTITK
jgi:acid phosphatase type 7